jgi:DNA polymerase-1
MECQGHLVVIDGNSLINRAFYALPPLTTKSGVPTGAVYGFLTMLFRLWEEQQPDCILVAFDKKGPTFRHQEYAEYKAHRKGMPDELAQQLPVLKEVLAALGVTIAEVDGYEADDVIGSIVQQAEEAGYRSTIVTGDRDALQLISQLTRVLLTKRGITETVLFDEEALRREYGLNPAQVIDLKGLMGDSSDNIPGIPGVGEKTALKLLQTYQTVEELLEKQAEVPQKSLRAKLQEYGEQALLSKRLATIDRAVSLGVSVADCRIKAPDETRVRDLFARYEFRRLWEKIPTLTQAKEAAVATAPVAAPVRYQLLRTEDEAGTLVADWAATELLAIYPGEDLLAMARRREEGWQAAVLAFPGARTAVAPLLASPIPKAGHAVKPFLRDLAGRGLELNNLQYDCELMAYLLDASQGSYPLTELAERYLAEQLPPVQAEETTAGAEMDELAKNAIMALALAPCLAAELAAHGLLDLYQKVELPLIPVLAAMEQAGVALDTCRLQELEAEFSGRIRELEGLIYELAGQKFNINSSRQLAKVLFEDLGLPPGRKTKTGYSTDAGVLEKLAPEHPIAARLLDYRHLVKLQGTYVEGLQNLVNPDTGRIHTTFCQTVTATGRLSSMEPNLQNIPVREELGRQLRKAFVPRDDKHLLVGADYSQIELRVLAHLSGDEHLIETFRRGEDIHTRTAAEVFGVAPEAVTRTMRDRAKAVNFGIVYGISDFGLSRDIAVSRAEARSYIEGYFQRYQRVQEYLQETVAQARQTGYVTTLLGRRRYLPDLRHRNYVVRSFAERMAMNTPIQGTAADIIKLAMLRVQEQLRAKGLAAQLILQVHDELILDVPLAEVEQVQELVVAAMENVMELSVPLRVSARSGRSWYELK